jgi:putative heme utilization carrier protein HutX
MSNATPAVDQRATLAARLAANADGVIETLAREHGLTTLEATRLLPAANCRWTSGSAFIDIFGELTQWGDVLFLVHTPNLVLECQGPIPPGKPGHGFFNLSHQGPIGGHLKADRCEAIAFVRRPFMGLDSCSIQFFDGDGDAMFKIFVRRNADRSLDQEQVAAFEDMGRRFAATGS